MKRLHATLILICIAACVAVMIGKEVWLAARAAWKGSRNDHYQGARRKARPRAAR